VGGALHVAGGEPEQRLLGEVGVVVDGGALAQAGGAQVVEQPTDVVAGELGLERPGGVGVADGQGQVGDALEHHALVGDLLGDVDGLAVHRELDAAEEEQVEAGGGHDDVRRELLAGAEPKPGLGEGVDVVGDHRRGAGADGGEEVAVGHHAEALVPRAVVGGEVGVDVVAGGQVALQALAQRPLDHRRAAATQLVEGLGTEGVDPAGGALGVAGREGAAQRRGHRAAGRCRGDVAGGPLEHGHVGGGGGQRGHERDRGGAAADDHDSLARVVEVLGPVLGVHDGAPEAVHAGEVREAALVVAVVAAAGEQEPAGELHRLAGVGALGGEAPAGVLARPGGP
jgi:hypothetical protein